MILLGKDAAQVLEIVGNGEVEGVEFSLVVTAGAGLVSGAELPEPEGG